MITYWKVAYKAYMHARAYMHAWAYMHARTHVYADMHIYKHMPRVPTSQKQVCSTQLLVLDKDRLNVCTCECRSADKVKHFK